jgi:hypothetical protein
LVEPEALPVSVIAAGVAGVGFTVMVYEDGVPLIPLTVGITIMVAIIAVVPVFTAVNCGTFPEPLEAKPIAVLEFVQAKVPPTGELTKLVAATIAWFATVLFAGTVTVGIAGLGDVGVTVIV